MVSHGKLRLASVSRSEVLRLTEVENVRSNSFGELEERTE